MISYPVWINILLHMGEDDMLSITLLARQMNASYTNIFNMVKELESKNILTITKNGRNSNITLTTRGMKIFTCLHELRLLLEEE